MLFHRAVTVSTLGRTLPGARDWWPVSIDSKSDLPRLILDYLSEEGLFVQMWPLTVPPYRGSICQRLRHPGRRSLAKSARWV